MMQEQPLLSREADVKSFASSVLWDDICTLLTERIDFLHSELEKEVDFNTVRYLQGQLSTLRAMLEIPEKLLSAVVEQKQTPDQD